MSALPPSPLPVRDRRIAAHGRDRAIPRPRGELARTAQTRGDFLPTFLADLGTLLGAAGVQFWELLEGDRVERVSDVSLTDDYHAWAERPASFTEPLGTIRAALAASSPIVVAPSTSAPRDSVAGQDHGAESGANPSPFLWIASTVHTPHRPAGVCWCAARRESVPRLCGGSRMSWGPPANWRGTSSGADRSATSSRSANSTSDWTARLTVACCAITSAMPCWKSSTKGAGSSRAIGARCCCHRGECGGWRV